MPVYDSTGKITAPRLPRLGTIRLGIKVEGTRKDGTKFTRPVATEHFVLTDSEPVAAVFGEKPTSLEPVIIPGEDEEVVASHWLRMYSATWGLVCIGDNRSANRQIDLAKLETSGELVMANRNTKHTAWRAVKCPCPLLASGECRETMYLRFMLPTVEGFGVWQISTGSANSIKNIQGFFALLKGMAGRISGIPLRLSLVAQEVVSPEGGRKTVRVLRLDPLAGVTTMDMLAAARKLPATALMPVIEVPPATEETRPEDIDDSIALPPEVEEAEYLPKGQAEESDIERMAREAGHHVEPGLPEASAGIADSEPPVPAPPAEKQSKRNVNLEELTALAESYGLDAPTHVPIVLRSSLGDYLKKPGHSWATAKEEIRKFGEARKPHAEHQYP